MRIVKLAALPFPSRQGTQVTIQATASALARAGHDVALLTYGPAVDSPDESFPFELRRLGKTDVGVRSGPSLKRPLADVELARGALAHLSKRPLDVLHAHHFEALPIGLWLRSRLRVPLVYHAHSALGPELPSYVEPLPLKWLGLGLGMAFDRLLPRLADAVVVFDEAQAKHAASWGVARHRVRVIPPGIDPAPLSAPDLGTALTLRQRLGPGPVVLYAGNPDRYQNLPLLAGAMRRLQAEHPRIRLLVLSHHPSQAFAAIWRAAGISPSVVHWPLVADADLAAAHAVANIGVVPRNLSVGAPIKLCNYLAAGLPTVAVRQAAQSMLPDGAVVQAEPTETAFAEGMLDALERASELGSRAREAAQTFFAEKQVPAYEALYRSLLARPG